MISRKLQRRLAITFFGVALALGIVAAVPAHVANAAFGLYGRAMYHTYYSNVQTNPPPAVTYNYVFVKTGDVPYLGISQNWQTQAMTADIFVAEMKKRLYSPTPVNSSRASAIINMMMGTNATDASFNTPSATRWQNGVTVAKANFASWEARVRAYDAADRIIWKTYISSAPGQNDHDWLGLPDPGMSGNYSDITPIILNNPTVNDEVIEFVADDGSPQFIMKKKCANLSQTVGALDVITPTPSPTPPTPPTPLPPPPPPPPPVPTPYLGSKGGDVVAGAGIASSAANACGSGTPPTPLTTAGIVSWNDEDPGYGGAGTQYAAYAMSYVQDFATSQGNTSAANGQPAGLTFANTNINGSVSYGSGLFGGMFGSAPCANYWNNRPASAPTSPGTVNLSPLASGVYNYSGNVTLSGIINPGDHVTIYVEGNVAISGDIKYAGGTYSSRSQIPSFQLIVHGSIFIGANVTALDGLYVAVPNAGAEILNVYSSPSAGTISTCSNGFASYDPTQILTNNMFTDCNKRLVVTGSVVAQQLWPLRTLAAADGSLSAQSAEEFDYSPEMWLAPAGQAGAGSTSTDYQSIIGLPPVL